MVRKNVNTTIDENLWKQLKILSVELDIGANDLLEEAMRYILIKHGKLKKDERVDD